MKRFAKTTLATAALALVTFPAYAANSKPLITYFLPMPIMAGKLSTTVWGASAVGGARDPSNGLEDNGASGGVGAGQESYFYWDGKILFGRDGKYHMYASRWPRSVGFGPPSGGSNGWQHDSVPMQAISDNVMGPYVNATDCYTRNTQGNNFGHNTTALIAPSGTSPYTLSVGEIVPGQMFTSSSPSGPWALAGLVMTNINGHNATACGDLSSNFTFTIGPDSRFWATSRGGCIMDSDNFLGTYRVETNPILPNLEKNDNGDAEDEVIWYSGGYFHVVYNYWNVQRAYHIMSKDGTTGWTSTGLAYEGTQLPTNANSNWLRYTDGTVNHWWNMERPGVFQDARGHVTHFTFAVTDQQKNTSAVNNGGSKVIVVPFNGVQFDCDNGDSASCAELQDAGAPPATDAGADTGSKDSGGSSGVDASTSGSTGSGSAGGSGDATSGAGALTGSGANDSSVATAGALGGRGDLGSSGAPATGTTGASVASGTASGNGSNNQGSVESGSGCAFVTGGSDSPLNVAWVGGIVFAGALVYRRRRASTETGRGPAFPSSRTGGSVAPGLGAGHRVAREPSHPLIATRRRS